MPLALTRIFFLFIMALLPALPALASVASLSGTVKDASTGLTIPGADVYFPDLHTGTVTDNDGHFFLGDLPHARALVKVSMGGYATLTETIDLTEATAHDFLLVPSVTEMQAVVVTGTSRATELKRDPVPTVLVDRAFLRENASSNAIESLARVPGISTSGSGPNVSKPIIRGLGGNRVLTLFNGMRQEEQQWGEEHGVGVDQFLVDRVEVVKGPASLMYGSDAMAGVINLIPAPPVPAGNLSGSGLGLFDTNNKGLATSAALDGNNGRFFFGGRLSAKAATNFRNRYDGRVLGTKYQEKDVSAYAGLNRPWGMVRLNASLYDDLQEVPDGSRDSSSGRFTHPLDDAGNRYAIADDGMLNSWQVAPLHQHVQYYRASAHAQFHFGEDRLAAVLGYQRSIRREYNHPGHQDVPGLYLILNTLPFDLKFHFAEKAGWQTTAGLNGMAQHNDAGGGTELVIPGFRQFDLGPFVHARKSVGKWDFSGGLRYDLRSFRSEAMYTRPDPLTGLDMAASPVAGDTSIHKHFDAVANLFTGYSGSIGAAWNIHERVAVKANLGRGYRAPSAAESTARGVHPGTGVQQLGDAQLKPEFNWQQDLGIFYSGTHLNFGLELFSNTVDHYIYNEKLVSHAGGDSLYVEGGGSYPVFQFRQTRARLRGGEVSVDIHPHPHPLDRLHFENSLSVVFGENLGGGGAHITDSTRYLPTVPPLRISSVLRYDIPGRMGCFMRMFARAGVQVFAAQHRIFSAYGTETRTPGYTLLEAGLGGEVVTRSGRTVATITVLASNLANVAYQSHTGRLKYLGNDPGDPGGRSGIYEMGRNISLKLVVPFRMGPGKPAAGA